MDELIDTLKAWVDWFENPEGELPAALTEETAQIGIEPHGFNSDRFLCRFETENATFDANLLITDKDGEENTLALAKLALIVLNTAFDEKVNIQVDDDFADYNGGTLEDFLALIDKLTVGTDDALRVIYP